MTRNGHPRVMIVGGARTPIGVKCGTLKRFAPEDLATLACEEAIKRSGVPRESIDTAVGANVYQFTAPGAQDIYFPRNVALRCKLKTETPALMVQRICGSGLQAVISAMQQLMLPDRIDDAKTALCFGGEVMSRAPQIIRAPRRAASFWEFEEGGTIDDSLLTGLNHDLAKTSMMVTGDEYGAQVGITRAACDEFATVSHERARRAYRESHLNGGEALKGLFAIDAVDLGGQPVHLARDECVRNTSVETLAKLRGLTPNKLVSAGNASELGDGAAALVATTADEADRQGWTPRFELLSYGVCGVEPRVMGRGPVPSIGQAIARAGLTQKDIDLFEINEAFAAQYLAVEKEMNLPREKVNVNGGAIAIGHPLAATGVRMIVDLMYEMERRGVRYGCASACIGGGQGAAVILRNQQLS